MSLGWVGSYASAVVPSTSVFQALAWAGRVATSNTITELGSHFRAVRMCNISRNPSQEREIHVRKPLLTSLPPIQYSGPSMISLEPAADADLDDVSVLLRVLVAQHGRVEVGASPAPFALDRRAPVASEFPRQTPACDMFVVPTAAVI